MSNIWEEDHQIKKTRYTILTNKRCPECDKFGYHHPNCTAVDDAFFRKQALFYVESAKQLKKQKDRYYDMLQRQAGKIAILKLENNKLRAKLRRQYE